MENTSLPHLMQQVKTLVSEGNCMAQRLEEYKYIISARDKEIEYLQQMVTDANDLRSSLENQLRELENLKEGMNEMKQMADTALYTKEGLASKPAYQLRQSDEIVELKEANTHLQLQLSDLQNELKEMKSLKQLFIDQVNRISQLDSLLQIAEEEIELLKYKKDTL